MNARSPIILAVDDNVENLDILSGLLVDYDVRDVTDAASALRVLDESPVDLILLDILMPGMDGIELSRLIQGNERMRAIPIIFISAMSDEVAIERAFEAGGKDYVTKPFRPRELLARVRTQLELRSSMERLRFLADHDPLTGAPNRRSFFELGTTLFGAGHDLSAVLIDIDHFKQINDRYGHGVGDEALRRVSQTIAAGQPPGAVFGRIGGEEFAILLPGADTTAALRVVEPIRMAVAALPIPTASGQVHCTISGGIARRAPATRDIDALMARADEALYQAKDSGRNRVLVWDDPGHHPAPDC